MIPPRDGGGCPAVRVGGLVKRYGARAVLKGVDLEIAPGERVALVGPNGSGKTTLMRCLLGLVRATGQVRIAGHDAWTEHEAAQVHVAYVPQRAPALPATVGQVVEFWSATRRLGAERLGVVARVFGLDVEALGTVPFTALSGGTQQKLLAAMALATECPILLFDEPTANLDPQAREVFLAMLRDRRPAPTVVLSSHRLEEVTHLVDRVLVLTDGRISFDAPVDRFLAEPGVAAAAGMDTGGSRVVPFGRTR